MTMVRISQVHVSLAIQYAADAIGKIAELVDRDEFEGGALEGKIYVAKTALDRALQALDNVPKPKDKD